MATGERGRGREGREKGVGAQGGERPATGQRGGAGEEKENGGGARGKPRRGARWAGQR